MEKQLNNEVILIGKMISGLYRIQVNNKRACRVLLKVVNKDITSNIPVVFINPNEEYLKACRNKELAISGHIETKWGMRIIVDSYKTESDNAIHVLAI